MYDYSYHYYIKPNNIFSSVNEREERHRRAGMQTMESKTERRELGKFL